MHNGKTYLLAGHGNKIFEIADKSDEGTNAELTEVWSASNFDTNCSDLYYNASLTFPSATRALYSNGQGLITLIDVENQWKTIFEDDLCGKTRPLRILTSSTDEKVLHIIAHYIMDKTQVENLDKCLAEKASNFVNVIEWLELDSSNKIDRCRRFIFLGEVESIESAVDGILFFGEDKSFQLIYDSAGIEEEPEPETEAKPEEKAPAFYWMQGVEDMVIWVMLPENINKREIKVTLKPSHMSIKIKDETILDGKLWNIIDSESLSWTIDTKKHKLEINMSKANVGMIWQRFIADKSVTDGEEVSNPEMVEKIHEQFAHLSTTDDPNANDIRPNSQVYNAQELEACDENSEITRVFLYIKSPKEVKRVNVGDRPVLFSGPSICLRHDVDGLLWQPLVQNGVLKFEHIDTFDALGYVQASKSQRRFTVCSPDRNYTAIIDRARHVYVYRKPEPISEGCELRNRKSGQSVKKVAKQQVPTLEHEPDDFVVGALATEKVLYVATTAKLYCLKIR